jgi:hypothetical protein
MNYTTKQTSEEIRQNVAALKRLFGAETRLNLIAEQGMSPKQLAEVQHNAAAFDSYLRSKHTTDGVADYSVQNLKEAYVFLRDNSLLDFEVAPRVRKHETYVDSYGRPIRDLRREREEAHQRDEDYAKEKHYTIEDRLKETQRTIEINKGIEQLRGEIDSFQGKSHGETFRVRGMMTEVLNKTIQNNRTIAGLCEAKSDISLLSRKSWGG